MVLVYQQVVLDVEGSYNCFSKPSPDVAGLEIDLAEAKQVL
jgi:hypothetical protein